MLRSNLSTRPFYNERLVHIVLAIIAGLVLAVTLMNIVQLIKLSSANTSLSARMRDDRVAADDYAQKARQTRQRIDQKALQVVVTAASEANAATSAVNESHNSYCGRQPTARVSSSNCSEHGFECAI